MELGESGSEAAWEERERRWEAHEAMVAHELRNPLQSISLQLEMAMRRVGSAESVPLARRTIERMLEECRKLNRLVADLLDAARLSERPLDLELRSVEVAQLVEGAVEGSAGALEGRELRVSAPAELPPVRGDLLRLEQVLLNLLENAAKYSAPESPIDLVASASGGGLLLEVHDRGEGIAPAELPRLFERYYQTKRPQERRKGLGLGLYIAKGLVEAHGGKLWAESERGRGSSFFVWLPADISH